MTEHPNQILVDLGVMDEVRTDASVETALYSATDDRHFFAGRPVPALTTMLYRVCGNDGAKFEEACRIVRRVAAEAVRLDREKR